MVADGFDFSEGPILEKWKLTKKRYFMLYLS